MKPHVLCRAELCSACELSWDEASVAHDKRKPNGAAASGDARHCAVEGNAGAFQSFDLAARVRDWCRQRGAVRLQRPSGASADGARRPLRAIRSAASVARSSPARAISSGGVDLSNGGGPYEVLNVTNLTTDIAPASGVTASYSPATGRSTLNVDPGPFAIIATTRTAFSSPATPARSRSTRRPTS